MVRWQKLIVIESLVQYASAIRQTFSECNRFKSVAVQSLKPLELKIKQIMQAN